MQHFYNASAGTGKTYTIIQRYQEFIDKGFDHKNIMITTFTRKATQDLREKLNKNCNILTIDSLIHNILSSKSKYQIINENENFFYLQKVVDEVYKILEKNKILKKEFMWRNKSDYFLMVKKIISKLAYFKIFKFYKKEKIDENFKEYNDYEMLIQNWKQILIEKKRTLYTQELAKHIFNEEFITLEEEIWKMCLKLIEKYEQIKENNFTSEDILNYTFYKMYIGEIKLDYNLKLLMIDEFQDTSEMQWYILNKIKSENKIIVGDKKQSIYQWRDGNNKTFDNVMNKMKVYKLDVSYRSSKNIVQTVNKFFSHYYKSNIKNESQQEGEVKYKLVNKHNFHIDIINDVENFKFKNSAIICRKNSHLNSIEKQLKMKKIKYNLDKNINHTTSIVINNLKLLLEFITNLNLKSLLEFFRSDWFKTNLETLEYLINTNIVEQWKNGNFLYNNKVFILLKEIKKYSKLSALYFTKSIFKLFNESIKTEHTIIIKDIIKISARSRSLEELLVNIINYEMKLEMYGENLTLLTAHKSKGLEFDNVFIYWDFSFSHPLKDKLEIDFNLEKKHIFLSSKEKFRLLEYIEPDFYNEKINNKIKEEINTFYVAITRAKLNVYLYVSFGKNLFNIEKTEKIKDVSDIYYQIIKKSFKEGFELNHMKEIGLQ